MCAQSSWISDTDLCYTKPTEEIFGENSGGTRSQYKNRQHWTNKHINL